MKISGTNELLEIDIQRTPSMTQGYTFGRGPLRSLFSCCLNFAYFCQRFLSLKLNVCKMKSSYKLIVALWPSVVENRDCLKLSYLKSFWIGPTTRWYYILKHYWKLRTPRGDQINPKKNVAKTIKSSQNTENMSNESGVKRTSPWSQ